MPPSSASARIWAGRRAATTRSRSSRFGSGSNELLTDDRVHVLENTRFDARETANDPSFAQELAAGCDLFVNDAFGSAHRAHASTEGVAHLLPAYAGLLLLDELRHLGALLGDVERPFVIVSGGAKVDDKIGVLENLGGRADAVLIGGKMAEQVREENPFSFEAVLPVDVVAASAFAADAETRVVAFDQLPEGWLGLDIGPRTREEFAGRIAAARTVFWNGPMGVFEWPPFAERDIRRRARPRRMCRRSRSSAAAIRSVPCTRPASPTASPGSRPAAARRSNCSRGASCPASRRFRPSRRLAPCCSPVTGRCSRVRPRRPRSAASSAPPSCRADVDVVVCPPYVSLSDAVQALAGTEIGVFAQNCHWDRDGAFTGEVSAPMLRELGVYGTLVGHSERRQYFGETDETVARRAPCCARRGPARDRLRRRDRGRARGRRHRRRAAAPGRASSSTTRTSSSPTSRSGRSAPARPRRRSWCARRTS